MGGSCSTKNPPVDSNTVTDYDKKIVKSTWCKLYKQWDEKHGSVFFIRLFNNHPDVKTTFSSLTHKTNDEILQSTELRAHVLVFGNTVNTWVQQLDDTDTLIALIQKLADSHVVRGIKNPTFFKDALTELQDYASEEFGFNQEQMKAWTKIAHLISNVLEQRMKS